MTTLKDSQHHEKAVHVNYLKESKCSEVTTLGDSQHQEKAVPENYPKESKLKFTDTSLKSCSRSTLQTNFEELQHSSFSSQTSSIEKREMFQDDHPEGLPTS